MTSQRLPGFTAELASYKGTAHYWSEAGPANHGQVVVPQRMTWWEGVKCAAAISGAAATCATVGTSGIGLVACGAATVAAVDYCDTLAKD